MLPSSTVENYLKAIYHGQAALPDDALVPMGQLASALGVVPGTATAMVKTLAESGLVTYEPYAGVRLTPAGEKLAMMVLRRHRLIELFLVEIVGLNWSEVHEEAELLEHVVSDRLIQRLDEMLGYPAADPHGDPIPDAEGVVKGRGQQTLLTCPLATRVRITRVLDQNPAFLKFLEDSRLVPGRDVRVESRDEAADRVSVRTGERDQSITMGTRAASKLLVETVLALMLVSVPAMAQSPHRQRTTPDITAPPPHQTTRSARVPFEITDNSFLIEEAFNQEPGIFQNIFGFNRGRSDWALGFTQEWPLGGRAHQFSYTIQAARVDGSSGLGDLLLNYRHQLATEERHGFAAAPRLSLILPSGDERRALGDGVVGWQVNVPISKQLGDVYLHANAGLTHLPGVDGCPQEVCVTVPIDTVSLTTPHVGLSVIGRVRPMFNLMFESLLDFPEDVVAPGLGARRTRLTVLPGFRTGWNFRNDQLIVGFGIPVELDLTDRATGTSVFVYLSYELPFKD